ncbi:hypothetical protein EDD66_112106 [Mobilisporobacter senegalensis]|uniref:Uncharacterized protein n=1 Tax=Mobilisporobacter senegalensis TaxID=1329262 RepID=A0A3N1XB82_9FIRM|nr:VCBS repeat-containing protein [Mobilisporobacter senegalensis]ROR23975.1 hypothetical protein EDD66_112106 [Mobilisporobacter senegalensis]
MTHNNFNTNMGSVSIVDHASGDVNGDRIADNIYLTGITSSDTPVVQNIRLIIQNSENDIYYSIPLKENIGYDPKLFLGDFTGDGIDDILISIATGGSGGTYYYYIYSFAHNSLRLLFDSDIYNEQYKYNVTYQDNYKVEVLSIANNTKYIIDLTLRDADYLNEVYDNNGELYDPIEGWVNPISGLYPIDFDSDNVYELLAFQRIAGRYNADSLGYVQNTLKWDNNMFDLDRQEVAIFGSQGSNNE